ncbi:hypothetical protein L1987_39727 [Smallanthus sonchifolius]|uniref:Uncharacterized protein n=1 Tax=Smallanthus sonchifolius TaxID=185202 RepID=A0ACB9HQC2_9ASTR|nr:hypothetical protein L1987_39727 [Smallanthus sonchifolius]
MKRVCVTGAGGYIGSWVVKLLLSKGYMVHGTVRDPCDEDKNGHLKKLENAEERLHLFKADLLDFESLCAAFAGCAGVLHVASPVLYRHVPNPQAELLDPAILGTQNVLNACLKAKVEKVVVVSSGSAVMVNPELPPDMERDESCWTDIEYAKSTQNWYAVAKTTAEIEALTFAKRHVVKVVTICPSLVIGPMLQSNVNATSLVLLSYMKDSCYEPFPLHCFTEKSGFAPLNSNKLLNLGWNYRPLEETIVDTIKNYEKAGLLVRGKPFPSTIRQFGVSD